MFTKTHHLRSLLIFCVINFATNCYSQDTPFIVYHPDTFLLKDFAFANYQMPFSYLYQSPDEEDEQRTRKYGYLANQQPTSKNHEHYFDVACSYWHLNQLKKAEQMFLNIINSNGKYYTTTYHHSSDVPGDTTPNSYGYGSFTSNYKNYAGIYLCKIYLKQKQFDRAFKYLELATKKYKVYFTCGTGYHQQKEEYDFLYGSCYEGMKQYKKVLDLLLPECLNRNDQVTIRSIRKLYSPAQIKIFMLTAESSMTYVPDSLPSYVFQTSNSGEENEKTDTLVYHSGTATMNLFGKTIELQGLHPEKSGDTFTKEDYLKRYKESTFYQELSKTAGLRKAESWE